MKKVYTCGIVILSVIVILLGGFFILKNVLEPKTYSDAKIECVKVLNKNYAELNEFAEKLLTETPHSIAGEYPKSPMILSRAITVTLPIVTTPYSASARKVCWADNTGP